MAFKSKEIRMKNRIKQTDKREETDNKTRFKKGIKIMKKRKKISKRTLRR